MAEDQTQQTRVLLVNGQTIIIQGDVGDDAINEINADLLQQALHEVSSSTDAQEGVGEEYSTDNQLLESEGGNYVIVQGEEGESTTIQLTTEQAEALGIHFSAEGEVKSETSENTSEGNVTIAAGDGQLIYTDNSSQNGNELVFKNTSSNGSSAVIQVQGGQMADTQTCQVVQQTSGIDVLSNTVNAFMDDGSNQPISLIPQIVNGQVTYTVKIQDNSSNNVVLPENQFQSAETNNKEPSVSFHSSATSNTITSYVTPSGSSVNYGSSSSSQGMSIQTLPLESFHSVEGNILTDSQNVQYVIMPPSDTDGRTMMVQNAVQPDSSFETFQPVKSAESGVDSQVSIAGVYSTVTAVDTSSPVTVAPPTIPVTKSLPGTPIENTSSINAHSVPSGSLSTVASSMNKSGMVRVVTSDRSILQPLNARSGANKYSGTSILSNTGRLATTVSSGIGTKTVTINSSGLKSSLKFKAVAPTPAKPTSLLTGFSKLTPFTPGTARILPTTSAKVVTINPITSKVTVPTKQSLLNTTSNLALKSPLTSASLVLSSDSPRLSTSSTPTSSILTSTSIAPTLKTRILPATPKVATIHPTMARLGLNSSTQKVVPISSATPKIVTVNTYGPKIVSVSGATGTKNTTSSTNANTSQTISTSTSLTPTKMVPAKVNSLKPLGSSENPIQLVQHGTSFHSLVQHKSSALDHATTEAGLVLLWDVILFYSPPHPEVIGHSVQTLSESQLRQIATVLQQQNLDSTPRTKNVLYDAETKTRIIYRVVYPEDLDLHEPGSPSDRKGYSVRGRGKRGRPPKSAVRGPGRYDNRSVDMDLDEDGMLNDSTKDERKKLLPRTRSGRLSRPPRHMVKDYKRLHHLDFADADLDDSDGGYSDYQVSEPEEGEPEKAESKEELLEGLVIPKRKISSHFRCPTCQKIYLGRNRMARHFEMYPDHGNIDQIHVPSQTQANLGVGDSKTGLPGLNGVVRRGRGRGRRRGSWGAYMTPEARSQRRIIKLKESLCNMLSSYDENSKAFHALEQGTALEGPLLFSLLLRKLDGDTRHRFKTSRGTNVVMSSVVWGSLSGGLTGPHVVVPTWITMGLRSKYGAGCPQHKAWPTPLSQLTTYCPLATHCPAPHRAATSSEMPSPPPVPPRSPWGSPPGPPRGPPPTPLRGPSRGSSLSPPRGTKVLGAIVGLPALISGSPEVRVGGRTGEATKANPAGALRKAQRGIADISTPKKASKAVTKPSCTDLTPKPLLEKQKSLLKREVQERLGQRTLKRSRAVGFDPCSEQAMFHKGRCVAVALVTILCVGHTFLTHGFLLRGDPSPLCEFCDASLSVYHILEECCKYAPIRLALDFKGDLQFLLRDSAEGVICLLHFIHQAMTGCEAGELTEVCGPAVAGLLSLWDLMLLRVEAVRTEETYVATLCDELQALLEKVRSLASDMLKPRNVEAKEHHFELQDKVLCSALGLPCGVYNVDDRCLRSRKHSLSLDDDDDDDEASPPTKQAKADLSDDSNQPSRLLQPAHDSKLDLKKSVCPEVLSALTLVAKPSEGHLQREISGMVKGERTDNFDLQSTQEKMDVVESAATSVGNANISAQSFSNIDHHSEALQTVDEIVNESLKKLQFNTDAVSQSQSTVRRDSTPNRVNKYMVLSKSDDGGESFDPEIALASMGKVDQPSNSSDFATMNIPNDSGPSYTLVPMTGRTNIDDTHDSFLDMSHMETDSNDHRFDPEITMTTLGLECSSSAIKNEGSKFITSISAMDTSSKVSHSTKDLAMFNTNCSNPVVSHEQLTGKHVSSYSPEEMLASMEANNQTSDLKPSDVQFSLPIPQVKMEALADNNPDTFALVGENLLVRQSDKVSSYIVSGVKEENIVPVQSGDRQLLYQQSESTTNSSPFHAEITLAAIGGENQTVVANNEVHGIISSSFTPEMALAAMGEGDRNSSADSSEISFQVPLSTSRAVVNQTESSFDPEAALAAMGEGEQSVPVTTQFQPTVTSTYQSNVSSSSSTFNLQQGFMEVGLDESGPELDFEALSEEFNRNTRHS
uniref:DUF4764 domain-containing protein n=1 Tax=Timema genevievae TaxID=629358 RepID=A0A7R9K4I9_TIMGE|nr:unnamed protein product [Timema genevievae]